MENMTYNESVTQLGNPAKPVGEAGMEMLMRMSESHRDVTKWGLSFGNITDGEKVIDIGCGSGIAIKELSKRLPESQIFGIDYSRVSVELASANNKEEIENKRVTIKEASVENIPFDTESFDKAFTVESFYFWPDPMKGLGDIKRVLKTGGCVLIIADIYECSELTDKQRENIKKYNMNNPTLEQFKNYLVEAGYKNVVVHTKEGTTWVCACGYK